MDPSERILVGPGNEQRLVVIGRLSDGTTRDMTREVHYATADEGVVKAGASGTLTASSAGLTTVTARGMGMVATAQIGVVQAPAGPGYPQIKGNNFIDDLVLAKLRRLNIVPAGLSSDREFARRVYLDAIGLLPPPEELRAFVSDSRPDKRSRLIDSLLSRPEYVSHWTVKFEDWFRNCQLHTQGRAMGRFKDWTREWIGEDRPYNQVVRELLTSTGDIMLNPAASFWNPSADFMLKQFSVSKLTPTVSRLFLGVRMECAECHNHPLENFTQNDFYSLAAFFARLRIKHGYGEYRRTWYLETSGEVEHPLTKQPVRPKFLGGEEPVIAEGTDRRAVLADWITGPRNPYFARATVNRVWHEYFDAGIVEPFDDFRSTNMATNRELLDRLAGYFVDNGFRFKPLHRLILNSRTYQFSSARNGESSPAERLLFARYSPRKLPAEVLLDSIVEVTGVPHNFRGYPKGTLAKDLYIPDSPDYFLVAFGFARRDIIAERAKAPTLGQALHLMNGESLRDKVEAEENLLGRLLTQAKQDLEIVSEIYERAYSRLPGENEKRSIQEYLASEQAAGRDRRRILENFLWAVLNSKEFQLNH